MASSLICEYCKKMFSSKSNFLTHQKTAKYCIELQGKDPTYFECEYCKKKFTSNQNQIEHSCKQRENENILKKQRECEDKIKNTYESKVKELERYIEEKEAYYQEKLKDKNNYFEKTIQDKQEYFDKTVQDKNEYIAKLEARLDKFETAVTNMAAEPKTSTKTTNVVVNNNTLNLSKEHVTKMLDEHFTKDIAAGGQKRLAQMVCEKMLTGADGKLTYKCVDPSRHTFEFINDDGDVERDVKAKKLTKALINSNVQQKAAAVGNQIWTKENGDVDSGMYDYCSPKVLELACLDRDDSKFRSELSALTSK